MIIKKKGEEENQLKNLQKIGQAHSFKFIGVC